jgi:SAM-dependent methyltransferase
MVRDEIELEAGCGWPGRAWRSASGPDAKSSEPPNTASTQANGDVRTRVGSARGAAAMEDLLTASTRDQRLAVVRDCPLCGESTERADVAFVVRQLSWDVDVMMCRICGLLFKSEFPTQELLASIYGPAHVHFADTSSYCQSRQKPSDRTRRLGVPRGRHLDYGCGAGAGVWDAQSAGWDSYGCDPFLPSIPPGHPLNGRLFRMDARDPDLAATLGLFDCITLWAVVEHLPCLRQTFEGLSRLLNPGANLIFNSPNGASLIARRAGRRWNMATLLEHVLFMTPRSVTWLAGHLGLQVERVRYCGVPYPMSMCPPGVDGQGLCPTANQSLPPMPANREPRSSPCAATSTRSLVATTAAYFRQPDGGGYLGQLARGLLDLLRIGDHIEVCFRKS